MTPNISTSASEKAALLPPSIHVTIAPPNHSVEAAIPQRNALWAGSGAAARRHRVRQAETIPTS